MATGDFADLKARAARAAQFDANDSTDLTRAGEVVNEAYLTICGDGIDWDFLQNVSTFTTVAGTDTYTLASIATALSVNGIRTLYGVTNDTEGGQPLEGCSWLDLERLSFTSQDDDMDGLPQYFAMWNGNIRLYPIPDAAYTMGIYYSLEPAELSADGDEPLIPLAHRASCIVPYAAALLLEQEGGGESMNDYDRRMSRFNDAYLKLRSAHGSGREASLRLASPGAFFDLDAQEYGWESY